MATIDELESAAERILRNAMCRAIAGDDALTMTPVEQAACLHGIEDQVRISTGMLRECLIQASASGANAAHRALHKQPGVDPFMLDEAVEHAGGQEGE